MPPRHGSGAAVVNPRPKWTPARRAFKEAPWRQQRLPSCVSSSVATAKSRPISRKFGKPRGTRNPDTVDWKKARRWEKRHRGCDELEVDEPLEGPTATVGAYQRADAKPTTWRDWSDGQLPRLGRHEYIQIHRRLQSSSSPDSDESSAARSPSPSFISPFDSRDRRYTPARCTPTAAPTSKSAPTRRSVDHGGGDADTESQDTAAESASSRVAWGNRQKAQLRQAVSAWQARRERRRHGEDTTNNVWSLLDRD